MIMIKIYNDPYTILQNEKRGLRKCVVPENDREPRYPLCNIRLQIRKCKLG